MKKVVIGLGNPGEEYENTRHNAGRIVMQKVSSIFEKENNLIKVDFLDHKEYMNNSGRAVIRFIKSKKDLNNFVVIYDDIDIPLGKIKISFNRSSGGHNGLESIIKAVKSQEFVRIRIGICPTTEAGKIKKPKGEEKILKFLLGEFKKEELEVLKKLSKKVALALEIIFTESKEKAMSLYN